MKKSFWTFLQGIYNRLKSFLSGRKKRDVFYIGGSESLPPPLSAQEEAECIQALGRGESGARSALIEHNLRLVAHIVKKYYTSYQKYFYLYNYLLIYLLEYIF